MIKRYYDLNTYLRGLFGCRVQKITVDAGLTCPNRDGTISAGGCMFCNASGSGTGARGRGLSVTEQLVQGKAALSRRYKAKKFIAYFQSFSNTYAPIARLRGLYEEALAVDDVAGLSIGTRPDCVDGPVLDLLADIAKTRLVWIEYGLQSAHDKTLAFVNRGHDVQSFTRAARQTRARGISVCAHVILGLPGETKADMMETAEYLADVGIDGIKIHLLYVVKETPLERLYDTGRYQCLSREAYVDITCDFLARLPAHVVVQRLTGDPHPDELAAPSWALEKNRTLSLIHARMEAHDLRQGCRPREKGR